LLVIAAFLFTGPEAKLSWLGYLYLTAVLTFRQPPIESLGASQSLGRLHRPVGLTCMAAEALWLLRPDLLRLVGPALLVLYSLFLGLCLRRLIHCLAAEERVDGAVLAGATAGYLLLGLGGGLLLVLLESLQPGSFRDNINGLTLVLPQDTKDIGGADWEQTVQRLHYFSFVSLTTLGYGDLTPVKPAARLAAVALAVLGLLYTSVVLGVLISRFGPIDPPSGRQR